MNRFYKFVGSALAVLAVTSVSAASWLIVIYQPKVPKSLR